MIKKDFYTFLHQEKRYEGYTSMTKTALTLSKMPVLKEELKTDVSSSFITQQDLKRWCEALQVFLLEGAKHDNPYTYCLLSCLQSMQVKRWQGLNSLQRLVVLSSLRSVMNNDTEFRQKIEQQIDLMLFFQEYQNLLKEVQQNYL